MLGFTPRLAVKRLSLFPIFFVFLILDSRPWTCAWNAAPRCAARL